MDDEWWGARTAKCFGSANHLPRSGMEWDGARSRIQRDAETDMQSHTNVATTLLVVEEVSIHFSDPGVGRLILRFEREDCHWVDGDGGAKVAQELEGSSESDRARMSHSHEP